MFIVNKDYHYVLQLEVRVRGQI